MQERILNLSKKEGLTHISSNLTTVDVLDEIYKQKKPNDLVILDNGHAHLAHLVAKEKYEGHKIQLPLKDIHCNKEDGCDVATGSLGMGIGISTGLALANRDRDVYTLVSDGGMMEGIFWECLRIARDNNLTNLKIHANCNGFGAYRAIDTDQLEEMVKGFGFPVVIHRTNGDFGDVKGLDGHYLTIK